jgi:hypothetical protein
MDLVENSDFTFGVHSNLQPAQQAASGASRAWVVVPTVHRPQEIKTHKKTRTIQKKETKTKDKKKSKQSIAKERKKTNEKFLCLKRVMRWNATMDHRTTHKQSKP